MTREAKELYKILLGQKNSSRDGVVTITFSDNLVTKIMQIKCINELVKLGLIEEMEVGKAFGEYRIL